MSVYSRLMQMCANKGVIPGEVEEECRIPPGTIARSKSEELRVSEIAALADYFDVAMDDIAGPENEAEEQFIKSLIMLTVSGRITWEEKSPGCFCHRTDDGKITVNRECVIVCPDSNSDSKRYVNIEGMDALWKAVTDSRKYKTADDIVSSILAMASGV